MLKRLILGLVALVALLAIVGFLLPDDAHVERSTVIEAPACTVFAQLTDFHRFNEWSPWFALDPNAQYTFSGPDSGPGAKMSWTSEDKNVGSGSQEIKSVDPFKEVAIQLDFGDQGDAESFYRLLPEGSGTQITWGFDTSFEGNIIGRYFGLFMDSMVGGTFEEGLAKLKTVAEGLPQTDWCEYDIEVLDVGSRWIASAKGESGSSPDEIGAAMGAAFSKVMGFLGQHGLAPAGPPLSITEAWGDDGFRFQAGIPLASDPGIATAEESDVQVRELPATSAIRIVHTGAYTGLPSTYKALEAYVAAHGMEWGGGTWEEYLNDPAETPEDQLTTHVFMSIGG